MKALCRAVEKDLSASTERDTLYAVTVAALVQLLCKRCLAGYENAPLIGAEGIAKELPARAGKGVSDESVLRRVERHLARAASARIVSSDGTKGGRVVVGKRLGNLLESRTRGKAAVRQICLFGLVSALVAAGACDAVVERVERALEVIAEMVSGLALPPSQASENMAVNPGTKALLSPTRDFSCRASNAQTLK